MARELSKIDSPQMDSAKATARPPHEEIAQRAYEIFMQRGCPEGRDMEHWLEAEAQLMASRQPAPTATAAATSSAPASRSSRGASRPQANARR